MRTNRISANFFLYLVRIVAHTCAMPKKPNVKQARRVNLYLDAATIKSAESIIERNRFTSVSELVRHLVKAESLRKLGYSYRRNSGKAAA